MPFPVGVETVVLTGHQHLADGDGSPLPVRVRPVPRRVVSAEHGVVVDDGWVVVSPDDAGEWQVELLATDAEGCTPTGWTYRLETGGDAQHIALPAVLGTVDVSELLPAGEDGGTYVLVPGPRGAKGDKGDDGQDGASAYQLAVAGGYVGSQAQWIASLKGAKGDKGDKGDAGTPPTGDVVGVTRTVDKATDEQVVSSTALQDDDHLTVPVTAGGRYAIAAMLAVDGDPAADLLLTIAAPPGSTGYWAPGGITLGVSDGTGSLRLTRYAPGQSIGVGITTAGLIVAPLGTITAGANGSITIQWAQNVATGVATTLRAGSWLRLTRVA
ncbi:hypothetical protein ACFC3O_00745 [Streptomyces sp. NPDC056007]|uniref:hypothetical protein n=1 Tax=Streptomyces sp. NPDC056007 TaxID=3345678 RepID=UPI0035D84D38